MGLRITDNSISRLMVRSMQSNLSDMLKYQQMASTGRRLNSYGDDPRGVGAVLRYDALISFNDQYLKNLERARTFVESTDSALQDLTSVIQDARDIAMRESSASGTDASSDRSADEVANLIDSLLTSLNTSVEGNFLFGGFRTDLTPFVKSGGHVVYQGDTGQIQSQIGPHSQLTVNIPGSDFIGSSTAVLRGSLDVSLPLTDGTSLADLNLGAGWTSGSLGITDGTGRTWTVNLTAASDVAGVVAAINAQTGGMVTAAIGATGQGLQLTGTGPLTVAEVNGGQTAQSLGLLGSAVTGILVGSDVRGVPSADTLLSAVPTLAGALPLGQLVIGRDGAGVTVDLSGVTTFGELQAAFASAMPGITLHFDSGVLSLTGDGAVPFDVSDAVGSSAATQLGLLGTGTPARLFGVLEDLRDALLAHDKTRMRSLMQEMGAVEDTILGLSVKVGGREVVLDWSETVLQQRNEQLQSSRSRERDADIIETATELSKAEAAYQASLAAASRLFSTNLMKYLG